MTTLIGTNPDQIPINSMLGGMAYQDPDSINVKDFNSSGTANIASLVSPSASITNLSYSGTLTGGTGVINIGSNQIYKDASGNIGLGAVPISNGKTLALVNTTTNPSSFYLQNSTTGFTTTDGTLLQLSGSASYLWNFENSTLSLATNNTEYVRLTSTGDLLNLGTGATKLQEGTTAQRPASPQEGMIRKNSTLGVIEGYSGGGYVSLEAGRLIARTAYQSAGSFTFTPSSKTKLIVFEVVSAGGGSGGISSTNASQAGVAIRGKNGKRVTGYIPYTESIGSSYSIVVGAGGIGGGGTASTAEGGGNGGNSSITNNSTSNALVVNGGGVQSTYSQKPTTFVASWSDFSSPTVSAGSHYLIWSQPSTTNSLMVFNTSASYLDLYEKVSPNGFFGLGGQAVVIAANDADGNPGVTGNSGEVIIYEYS